MNSDVTSFHLKIMGKVRLPNGGVYIKYYDEKNNKTVLIRKGTVSEEIHLIPIDQLDRYQYLMNALTDEQRKIANLLINNIDKFNVPVEYINFENGIVIDEQNHVIGCEYDKKVKNYVVRYINEIPAPKQSTTKVVREDELTKVSNDKYQNIINSLIQNGRPVEISGFFIDLNTIKNYYSHPEEVNNLQSEEKEIIVGLLNAYKNKIQINKVEQEMPKIKTKKNKKNSVGMQVLKASLSGFALGFVLSVLFLVAKKFF